MTQKRPINADTPTAVPKEGTGTSSTDGTQALPRDGTETATEPAPQRGWRPGRKPVPAAVKGIAGLVAIALVFLVAAIAGGTGSRQTGSQAGSPPPLSSSDSEQGETSAAVSNNTTRIEGDEPANLAANVALAVFPSTTPAQRPDAVTLVDESWQNAVAASVLMAPPIRAPLLASTKGAMPDATSQALRTLEPAGVTYKRQGNETTDGPQAYAIGPIPAPPMKTARTAETIGASQAAEIALLRDVIFRGPPKHVIVVSEADAAFAVPAAAWAARSGDAVLYVRADKLPAPTAAALKAHPKIPVYVLGPTSAISSSVMREIAGIVKRVKRVSGKTPAENAIALARYSDGNFGWNVNDPGHGFVIARSSNPLGAALASPLSASGTWGPLLLTESADRLPKAVREYLLDVKPGYTTDPTRAFYNHVWIIGNEEEIDARQQAEINQLAELTKVGGER